MLVRYIILGFVVAILSSATGIAYSSSFKELGDFTSVIPYSKIVWMFTSASLGIAGLTFLFKKLLKEIGGLIINIIIAFVTIGSVIIPTMYPPEFPKDFDEFYKILYPGFVIPLHFMVPMIWFALSSYFLKNKA